MKLIIDVDEGLVCKGFEQPLTEEERDILIRAIGNGTLVSTEGDLISRSELKKKFGYTDEWYKSRTVAQEIDNAPTVEQFDAAELQRAIGYADGYSKGREERPQGEWINHSLENLLWGHNECPFCHKRSNRDANFCQYCGADMRGRQ